MGNLNDKPTESVEAIVQKWRIPVQDLVDQPANQKIDSKQRIDFMRLRSIVADHAEKLEDADGIMELLPDLEIVQETLVSNILSPKDLKEIHLNIAVDNKAPPEFAEIIRDHFTTEYDLDSMLGDILATALFKKGSFIFMLIPPKAISNMIKSNTLGLESLNSSNLPPLNLLHTNPTVSYAMESMKDIENKEIVTAIKDTTKLVNVTDNLGYLAFPLVNETVNKKSVLDTLKQGYGLEALNTKKVPKNMRINNKPAKFLPFSIFEMADNTESDINPIVLNPPSESVIPVHVPGEPSNHVGYYIFLDQEGNPIHYSHTSNKFKEMNRKLDRTMANQTVPNSMSIGVSYPTNVDKQNHINETNNTLLAAYYEKFQRELVEAVSKGATNKTVEISNPGELYRIMFARQLEKQKTNIIYVPAEMVTYVAFNYSPIGTGISLIEKTKIYASFRAILMFASVMAGIKSSINRSTLSITLDDDDPDPQGTIETIINEYSAIQATGLPLGRLDKVDIVDSLQRAGLQVKIQGGKYPNTSMDIAETKREITPPDSNLMDMLKEIHYAGLWVNRDTIEHTHDADFTATQITSNNLMQAKRVQKTQKAYIEHLSNFIQKYIYLDGPLYRKLKEKYDAYDGKDNVTFEEIVDSVTLKLPEVDTAVLTSQQAAYTEFCAFIELAIEAYISEGMVKDMLTVDGEVVGVGIEDIKLAILNLLKRNYLRSQNMLPELDELVLSEETNVDTLIEQHNDLIIKLVSDISMFIYKTDHKVTEKMKDLKDKLDPQPAEDEYSSDDQNVSGDEQNTGDDIGMGDDAGIGDGTGLDEGTGDDLGGDDIGMDTDQPLDDTSVDETATGETEPTDDVTETEPTDDVVEDEAVDESAVAETETTDKITDDASTDEVTDTEETEVVDTEDTDSTDDVAETESTDVVDETETSDEVTDNDTTDEDVVTDTDDAVDDNADADTDDVKDDNAADEEEEDEDKPSEDDEKLDDDESDKDDDETK